MRFGPLPLDEARGAILAHSVRLADGSLLRKGSVLGDGEIALLEGAGLSRVTAAHLDDSDVPEDEAALEVARALAGCGTEIGTPGTGRCNVMAAAAGLVTVDAARIRRVNEIHESLTVATLNPDVPVRPGDLLATVKVIPYAAPRDVVTACSASAWGDAGAAVQVSPFRTLSVALVQTVLPGSSGKLEERAEAVLGRRLELLGSRLATTARCPHEPGEVTRALEAALAAGHDLVLLLGASAVGDRGDVLPDAVERAGGEVLRLGIPVDPGNLMMLARHGSVPVLGVPGCARSPRRNGFDWILEQVLVGRALEELDVPGMGVGGLLAEVPERLQPRRVRRARRPATPRVAGIVLAAGRSSRMGEVNKLLVQVDGVPMVRKVVATVLHSSLDPIVVVLGHDAEAVRRALEGLSVRFTMNAEYSQGIGTSVRTGIRAVAGRADGAMVVLGDMPWISASDLRALVEAFAPEEGRGICAPVVERKRGNPVLWGARYFPELQTLEGDVGARRLLAEHHEDVCEVNVSGEGVLTDVDTPQALDASRSEER